MRHVIPEFSILFAQSSYIATRCVGLLLVLTLASCALTSGQKKAISTFAAATSTLSTSISNNLPEMRRRVAEMNTQWIAITNTPDPGEPDPNRALPHIYKVLTTHGTDTTAFSSDNVALRIQAAETLHEYGNLLNQLSTSDQSAALKSSATAFENSVKALQTSAKCQILNSSQLDDVGVAVRAVGGLVVEWKRKKAVKEAVSQGKTLLPQLVFLLKNDFNVKGTGLAQGFAVSDNRLLTKADELLNPREQSFTCPPDPRIQTPTHAASGLSLQQQLACSQEFLQRPILVRSYRLAQQNHEWLKATAPSTLTALSKIDSAHQVIVDSLSQPTISFDTVTDFYDSVQELLGQAKAISGK